MTTLYKLTDEKGKTYGGIQWGEGVTHTAGGEGGLCGPGWIHAYTHPLLAVLLNPMRGVFDPGTMRLWECEGEVGKTDYGLKVGCIRLTTLREIPVPNVTPEQRVRFAILCARGIYHEPGWNAWAEGWLAGTDRGADAANAATRAATSAWGEAAWVANAAAWVATWVADTAAAADTVSRATALAARAAVTGMDIDLIELAHEAVKPEAADAEVPR